jgi:glutamine kinase
MIYPFNKAKTLQLLSPVINIFYIPKFISTSVISFKECREEFLTEAKKVFKGNVIVRSSAADEDGTAMTLAGEYDSVLNINSNNTEELIFAVSKVIASYEKKRDLLPGDEVIIQEMVLNTTMSGVIFTHDLNTGAPYYVINYDDQSGTTDTVTSGNGEYANRTLYIHRNSIDKLKSERFIKLLQAVQELERIMDSKFLDIEFALDANLTPYLLQVRAITTQPNWNRAVSKRIDTTLQGVQSFVIERFKRVPGVYGEVTVLGQMPDWNPVEMIGRAPRALAASIYQTLITDHAWRTARAIMGYKIPTGQPLMVMLAGQPFIDTRLSFNSYLPSTISPVIAEKLVDHWIKQLAKNPALHDKVEFEVAITTYSFDFDEKMEQLIGTCLTSSEKAEFKQAHLQQTMSLVKGEGQGSLSDALEKIEQLRKKQNASSSLFAMVDDCIHLGTVPFSILARHGFIAKTILISLQKLGIITQNELNQILASMHTVASELVEDMHSLQLGKLSTAYFMKKFGHLRPGTYDIMSHRYDQMVNLSTGSPQERPQQQPKPFLFSAIQQQQINSLLKESFDDFNADKLLNYIHEATVGREYGKFVFTRSVSDILELIAKFAEDNDLSRDEISHVPLDTILNIVKNSGEGTVEERLRETSKQELEKYDISVAVRLPQLLADQAGVHIVPFQVSHPNFITHKKVTAPSIVLRSDIDSIPLSGKIVIIEGADPGFDWIFSQKISGLITKYGGANSHMAIRCAEFGMPAAIGCGEQRYDLLLKANQVHIDCAAGFLTKIN